MSSADELLDSRTPMGADLAQGLGTLSLDQTIEFGLYVRVVLPIDGFVFWIRSDLAAQGDVKTLLSAEQQSEIEMAEKDGRTISVPGSLHYTGDIHQEEGELWAQNRVVLTSKVEVANLNDVAPGLMWIGTFGSLRFGFSSLTNRYYQANLWHYAGIAIYPDAGPNVVDEIQFFDTAQVVSNSLPAWLAMQGYAPPWAYWQAPPPIFPSMTSPLNEAPPFVTVHIVPDSTNAMASAPTISQRTSSHQQLYSDTVRLTLWGMRNDAAQDFVDMVYRYSLDTAAFGIMNVPSLRDEKRGQSELGLVTMKKTFEIQVSYLQARMRDIGQQVIVKAVPTFVVGP